MTGDISSQVQRLIFIEGHCTKESNLKNVMTFMIIITCLLSNLPPHTFMLILLYNSVP